MKSLQNLKGAKALNRDEQKSINGGTSNTCGYREYWCPYIEACISVDLHCPSLGGPGNPKR